MADAWLGCCVSVECRGGNGVSSDVYQGRISGVDTHSHTLTLTRVFRNGRPLPEASATLRASDIADLRFLPPNIGDSSLDAEDSSRYIAGDQCNDADTKVTSKETKRAESKSAKKTPRLRSHSCSVADGNPVSDWGRQTTNTGKRQDCFAVPVESFADDFDFEKNLALFDKEQIYNEIENEVGTTADALSSKAERKYRHDEMILPASKVTFRQIVVPDAFYGGYDYVTDSGLVVPSLSREARDALLAAAVSVGLTEQHQMDAVGRSACEMILQLIGGSNRLNPKNDHQRPTVVVFCAVHRAGAAGVSCARHLANHGVNSIVVAAATASPDASMLNVELELFNHTRGKRLVDVEGLPTVPVDMIVSCIDSHDPHWQAEMRRTPWYGAVARWCNDHKANVLTIDPPVDGGAIETKWALGYVLPLNITRRQTQVYLCDVGIPSRILENAGIKYKSPFGSKFCIPLHNA